MEDTNSFVRKDFYIDPPAKNASPEEWAAWLEADKRKAAAAKAAYTKSFEQTTEAPEWLAGNQDMFTVKRDGKHTQGTIVGFSGSAEEGTLQVERVCPKPMPDALMDLKTKVLDLELTRNKRGGSRSGKSARRRKNKRKNK
jgi:hypothetical protein